MADKVDLLTLVRGLTISLFAGSFIIAEMGYLVLNGFQSVFTAFSKFMILLIYITAFPAYYYYVSSRLPNVWLMKYPVPFALVIEGVGVVFLFLNNPLSIYLIVIGYFFEPIAGISLFLGIRNFGLYAKLFIITAWIFGFSLSLFLIGLGIVPFVTILIKMVDTGLLVLKMEGSLSG